MRTCKWCGKQYDEMKHPTANYRGCCSTRCMNALVRSKQQEKDRQERERVRRKKEEERKRNEWAQSVRKPTNSSRQYSSGQANEGCGLSVRVWLLIIVFFSVVLFFYGECRGHDSTDIEEVSSNPISEETTSTKDNKRDPIEEQQEECNLEVVDTFFIEEDSSTNEYNTIEIEDESPQIITDNPFDTNPKDICCE